MSSENIRSLIVTQLNAAINDVQKWTDALAAFDNVFAEDSEPTGYAGTLADMVTKRPAPTRSKPKSRGPRNVKGNDIVAMLKTDFGEHQKPFTQKGLLTNLEARGFKISAKAVSSHISRMLRTGSIAREGNGEYRLNIG